MGQDPGTSGPRVAGRGAEDPEQLREQIEHTRQELGDTVEALAAKTDIKQNARRRAQRTKASVTDKTDRLIGKAKESSPDSAAGAASRASQKARANPLPLAAAGAFLAGLFAGRITKR